MFGVNDEMDGEDTERPVFVADLEFEGSQFPRVSVVGDDSWPIALIGRDLLNELNGLLEGPAARFTLQRP